jgi:mitogen-activated protein kinase kinase
MVVFFSSSSRAFIKLHSLTVNQQMRPTPEDMLSHPWIILMMERKADMAEFISKVYGWKRRSGVQYVDGLIDGRSSN